MSCAALRSLHVEARGNSVFFCTGRAMNSAHVPTCWQMLLAVAGETNWEACVLRNSSTTVAFADKVVDGVS